MTLWHLDSAPAAVPVQADAVADLFGGSRQKSTAQCMLGFFNRVVQIDYLALVEYRYDRHEQGRVPELDEGHARQGVRNVTPDCFALYREHFWRHDEATRVAERLGDSGAPCVAAMHVQAGDIHVPQWREEIYERAGLAGRMNLVYSPAPARVFSVNLYRHRSRGGFGDAEIGRMLDLAALVRQAHQLALLSRQDAPRSAVTHDVTRAQAMFAAKFPDLSERELAVCARIACGISADGIAADLGIAVSSVTTLRKRAYAKLAVRGIHGGRMRLASLLH